MENIIEIRNRRITINTDMHREDYCKTAILFEVLDGSVTFSYEKHKVTLNKRDLLVINKGILNLSATASGSRSSATV